MCWCKPSQLRLGCVILSVCFVEPLYAGKTNQAVYQDPFDQAAGGSTLTRASQEAVMFANPALMVWGKKFFRWFGHQTAFIVGKDSVDLAQDLAQNAQAGSDSDSDSDDTSELISDIFTTPIHLGVSTATSFITEYSGFGVFGNFESDIKGEKHNDTGIPEVRARADSYYGAFGSTGVRVTKWWSLGVTARYMYKTEPDLSLSLADQEKVEEIIEDPQTLRTEHEYGQGTAFDVGSLFFAQGRVMDLRLALKVDDLGDTKYSKEQDAHLQTYHAGLGLTLHNSIDAIHLSVDYRDILGVYEEPWVLRTYAGVRVLIRNYVGIAVGAYQGYPSYGVRIDLLLVKLGATVYSKEMGEYAGDDPRRIYVGYFGLGF